MRIYVQGNAGDIVWTGALLPLGAVNENYVTVEFTVPPDVSQVSVGVLWSNPANDATFYINRVALYKLDWEYQYYLTDHLGSPRVVLGTDPATQNYDATFETENQADEADKILNIDYTYVVPHALANVTPGGNEVIRLNNSYRVGPSKSFEVFPGDKIDASVYAYYEGVSQMTQTPVATMAAAVFSALGNGVSAVDAAVTTAYANSESAVPGFLLSTFQGSDKPSAFINYILFDADYVPIEAKSVAVGNSPNTLHQIPLPQIQVKELGHLFIYLSYDNESTSWVYFDDFKIDYAESPVIQVNAYYPYGMTAYTWVRDGEEEAMERFQGKEYDSLTQWHDFHARQYDAALGRWFIGDPKGEVMPYISNYAAMMNSPLVYIDPDGECPICVAILVGAAIGAGSSAAVYTATALASDNFTWKGLGTAAGFGAVAGAIGGGIGGAFANNAFAQTVGFSILNNTASTIAGTAIMGGHITWGTVAGGVAGGLVGSGLPQFSGVKGSALTNIGAEIGYNAVRGGITGSFTGGVAALADGDNVGEGIENGFVNGAIGGAALAGVNIATLGPAYVPERTYGDFGRYKPIYRSGTFLTRVFFEGAGVTLGRNLVTNQLKSGKSYEGAFQEPINAEDFNHSLRAHETAHYEQQVKSGFANFYRRTIAQYFRHGYNVYGTRGTYEYEANMYSLKLLGYYYNIYWQKRTTP